MRNTLIILSLMLQLSPAQAGIRIINGGGGYAEMMALTAYSRMRLLIHPCRVRPEVCGLTEAEQALLAIQNEGQFFNLPGPLEFHVPETETDLYRGPQTGADTFSMSSSLLYDSAEQPKSYQEIARLVFVGSLKVFAGIDAEELSKKIFQRFLVRESELPLDQTGRIVRAFLLQSKISADREAFLTLQNLGDHTDMTDMLVDAVKCAGKKPAKILDLSGLAYESPIVTGHLVWQCGNSLKQAQFALHTHVYRVTIFKEKLIRTTCEGDLE